jgi:hypothetical protein
MKHVVWLLVFIVRGAAVTVILTFPVWCQAAAVVFISAGGSSIEQQELDVATQFYGVNLKIVAAHADGSELRTVVRQRTTIAVAIDARSLALVNQKELLGVLHEGRARRIPLMILGVTPETESAVLRTWSFGAVIGCKRVEGSLHRQYHVARVMDLTQQLSDMSLPAVGHEQFYLVVGERSRTQPILTLGNEREALPVFVEIGSEQQPVFMASRTGAVDEGVGELKGGNVLSVFTEIAPAMIFVKYCAGARAWHALHHYANLTIDDPWLREPYGHLDYKGLLQEMEEHNFHTTIAFIPWNYDRSEPEVVSLVIDHPDRFSICVHGDNHDHKEFTDLRSKPLAVQIADLKQSLARMEKFHTLTNIPYDKVMVFPHSIGSESVLAQLKAYDFLATINSSNVPMDQEAPLSPLFALRPITLSFANFSSITRYPATRSLPKEFVAVNEFLDNPLFLYSHQDFFDGGIDAFDTTADEINKSEPSTEWRSVGTIANHLYLVRLREDSNYDALALSSGLRLENVFGRDVVFYVEKREVGPAVIKSVTVGGSPHSFRLHDESLEVVVPVSKGGSRDLEIQYQNDLDLARVQIAHTSPRVFLLRMASDYRDIALSHLAIGRAFSAFYYKHEITPTEAIVYGSFVPIMCICMGWRVLITVKRKNGAIRKPGHVPGSKENVLTRDVSSS